MVILKEEKNSEQIKQCLSVIYWVLDIDLSSIKDDKLILNTIINNSCKNVWNSLTLTLKLSKKFCVYDSYINNDNIKHYYKIENNIDIPFEISLIERDNNIGILTMLYFK